jgi:hypothetical protein
MVVRQSSRAFYGTCFKAISPGAKWGGVSEQLHGDVPFRDLGPARRCGEHFNLQPLPLLHHPLRAPSPYNHSTSYQASHSHASKMGFLDKILHKKDKKSVDSEYFPFSSEQTL